ncbi:acyltransferase family protein [Roseateles sp. NT4]|uniref:acyltransferase family protein n=1 Tax=Roseateles sp. NT4 TaxID=3453715 RepID=UPI003EE954DE
MTSGEAAPASYRADIDGLRAVAILLVIAFHAFPQAFPGAYVGVDVFFVISGYVIARPVFRQMAEGTFDVMAFWWRRALRILPALLLLLVLSCVASWMLLTADESSALASHALSAQAFASNLKLWSESGYFAPAAETKPLLHLWSLAVEEQFYLVFPLLALPLARVRPGLGLAALALLAGLSAWAGLTLAASDGVGAFYAPWTRAWELLAGVALAWHAPSNAESLSRASLSRHRMRGAAEALRRHLPSLLGLLLLVAALPHAATWRDQPVLAVAPAVLAALMLIAAGPASLVNRLLSTRLPVKIGLLSYSLYLFHWPVLVFVRVVGGHPIGMAWTCFWLACGALLALASYRWVEMPARRLGAQTGRRLSVAKPLLAGGVAVAVFNGIALASAGEFPAGGPSRHALGELAWNEFLTDGCRERLGANAAFCIEAGRGRPSRVALLGDSTANSLAPGLAAWAESEGKGLLHVGGWSCPPLRGLVDRAFWGVHNPCVETMQLAYQAILASPDVDTVVLAFFARDLKKWGVGPPDANPTPEQQLEAFKRLLDNDVQALVAAGKRVVVTYDAPLSPVSARNCLPRPFRQPDSADCSIAESHLIDRPYVAWLDAHLAAREDVCVVRQSTLLLRDGRLQFRDDTGRALLRDTHHLSLHGSARMAEVFARSGCLKSGASI